MAKRYVAGTLLLFVLATAASSLNARYISGTGIRVFERSHSGGGGYDRGSGSGRGGSSIDAAISVYNFGVDLMEQKRWEEAERYFREAIRLRPTFGRAYVNLGVCLLNLRRYQEAAQAFQMSFQYCPDCTRPNIYIGLGYSLWNLARLDEAETAFRNAGNHPDAETGLAALLEQRRTLAAEKEFYDLSMEADRLWVRQDWAGAESVLRRLAAIRNDPEILMDLARTIDLQGRVAETVELRRTVYGMTPTAETRLAFAKSIRYRLDRIDSSRNPDQVERLAREGLSLITASIAAADQFELERLSTYGYPFRAALEKVAALQQARPANAPEQSASSASTADTGPLSGLTARLASRLPHAALSDPTIRDFLHRHQRVAQAKVESDERLAEVQQKFRSGNADKKSVEAEQFWVDQWAAATAMFEKEIEKRRIDLRILELDDKIQQDQQAIRNLGFDKRAADFEQWVDLSQEAKSRFEEQVKEVLIDRIVGAVQGGLLAGFENMDRARVERWIEFLERQNPRPVELISLLKPLGGSLDRALLSERARRLVAYLEISYATARARTRDEKLKVALMTVCEVFPQAAYRAACEAFRDTSSITFAAVNNNITRRVAFHQIDRITTMTEQQLQSLKTLSELMVRHVQDRRQLQVERDALN